MNGAADALSRRDEEALAVHSISTPIFEIFETLRTEAGGGGDPQVTELRSKIAAGTASEGWTMADGLLLFRGKVFVPDASTVWQQLLSNAHDSSHEGM